MNLSYSRIRTYTSCPLQYRFTYVDHLPRPPRGNLQLAKRIHVALRRYYLYAEYGPPEFQRIAEAYSDAWGARSNPVVVDLPAYQDGLQVLRGYYEAQKDVVQHPVMLEHRFQLQLGSHQLAGKIDRVDLTPGGDLEVIDYKLDREVPSEEELERDTQLDLYLLAVEELQGRRPKAAARYYLRHNKKVAVTKNSDEVERAARSVAALGDRIENDRSFDPTPGKPCAGCAYRKQCPAVSTRVSRVDSRWARGQPPLVNVGASCFTPELPGL